MSFKEIKTRARGIIFLLLTLWSFGSAQVVDCIVAEVNANAITLTDLRILQAFRLSGRETVGYAAEPLEQILQAAVDRKVVIDVAKQNVTVAEDEVDGWMQRIRSEADPSDWPKALALFGLNEEDLRPYLKEILLYEKIIGLRFSQGVEVSLKEIEAYYNEVLVPSEKAQGNEPKPMIQILDSIESQIKREKTEKLIAAWLTTLRQQAEVRINCPCLEQIKKEKERP